MAGLPVVPSLGLVWPSAAGGGFAAAVVVAGPGQGRAGMAGKTGPGQTKPRPGTTGEPAKPNKPDPPMN